MIDNAEFELSDDELRTVARFATESAATVLEFFEAEYPNDERPRAALAAARAFIEGDPRSNLQRTAAMDAHRASWSADSEVPRFAAQAASDAAASAYLHPISRMTQVGHILRASANVARVNEICSGTAGVSGDVEIRRIASAAPVGLIEVLLHYPSPSAGRSRVSQLMSMLDLALRARSDEAAGF